MPRYVLLEFESNEHAERFVVKTLEKEAHGAKFRVIGFFAKPRGFCKCGYLTDRQQAQTVKRGSKYGWMIHTTCGRPVRHAGHSPRNLMDPEGSPPRKMTAFLHTVGSWHPKGDGINDNYPISVALREDDE